MPYRALTSAPIAAMLRRVAARHGYLASRGPRAGQGDPVELAFALGNGELATVLLSDGERSQAIRWLDEQAKVLTESDSFLAETITLDFSQRPRRCDSSRPLRIFSAIAAKSYNPKL